MSENTNPLNDFLNMQEETPTMFGGFAFPPVTPDAVPTAPAQNPNVPAQPVPQAVTQPVEAPVAYTVAPPAQQPAPQQVPQQPVAPAAAPVQGSLFQAAMAQTPAGQQPAAQPAPVVQPIPQNVPAAAPAPQPAPQPAPAPDPAPEIANAPDPLSAALAKAKQQGDARLVEACATREAMFVYGKAKEPITDRDCTFENLREKYESDFPELAESKKVEWSVTYGKETKTIVNPGSDKIYDVKAEMEKSKKFIEGIKKGKSEAEKNPECIVKPRIKAQSKGEVIHLSSYKEFCSTEEEAHGSSKAIVLLPSSDGRVYQMRKTPVGTFTAQAGNLPEFPEVKPGFQMGLPKIPMHLLMFIWDFFAKLSERYELEALVHILYDMHSKEYTVRVPKQKLTHVSVDSVLEEEYPDHLIHVMDIHSHNTMPAKFSAVDDADEKPTRLYAVMGMLHRAFPDICVRASCAGHFIPVEPIDVFDTKATNFPHPSIWDEQIDLPDPEELSSMTPASEKFSGRRRFFRLGAGL